jgi:hypothetical protein
MAREAPELVSGAAGAEEFVGVLMIKSALRWENEN